MQWVQNNAVSFRSVDPDDTDFSDLQPLKELIGDAQIVQLGEQSHGDGKCFETKIRLIKFLHQEMGFDVLAFESGLYDCQRAWQSFVAGDSGIEAARLGIFGIWTGSKQTAELWSYLQQQALTNQPLELAGFDCQYTALASSRYLKTDLRALIKDSQFELDAEDRSRWLSTVEKLASGETPPGSNRWFLDTAGELRQHLRDVDSENRNVERFQFWDQQLKSMMAHARYRWRDAKPGQWSDIMARDVQMADNLKWLATEKYPARKIIVWAASFHIVRNIQDIEVPDGSLDYSDMKQMGHVAHETITSRKLYTIGFTAYEGRAGTYFRPSWKIDKAPAGTLEDIFFQAGLQNGLVPLTANWMKKQQFCRPLGYAWMRSAWSNNFDALIFNRRMTPSTRN